MVRAGAIPRCEAAASAPAGAPAERHARQLEGRLLHVWSARAERMCKRTRGFSQIMLHCASQLEPRPDVGVRVNRVGGGLRLLVLDWLYYCVTQVSPDWPLSGFHHT